MYQSNRLSNQHNMYQSDRLSNQHNMYSPNQLHNQHNMYLPVSRQDIPSSGHLQRYFVQNPVKGLHLLMVVTSQTLRSARPLTYQSESSPWSSHSSDPSARSRYDDGDDGAICDATQDGRACCRSSSCFDCCDGCCSGCCDGGCCYIRSHNRHRSRHCSGCCDDDYDCCGCYDCFDNPLHIRH